MGIHWRRYLGRKVRVHTADRSIEGVLVHASRTLLVFRGAGVMRRLGEPPEPLTGEVVVERSAVSFAQVGP